MGLVAPNNGSLSSTNITHGNFVSVSCNSGYKLEGNHTPVCFSGSLLGYIGTCKIGTFQVLHICHIACKACLEGETVFYVPLFVTLNAQH